MSDANEKRAADWDALHAGVYVPAYFARLAEHGLVPANEKQARSYLAIGDNLHAYNQRLGLEQANAGDDFLEKLAGDLSESLGLPGWDSGDDDAWVKEAHEHLTRNPDLIAAARSFVVGLAD